MARILGAPFITMDVTFEDLMSFWEKDSFQFKRVFVDE